MTKHIGLILLSSMALLGCTEEKSPIQPVEEPAMVTPTPAPDFAARMQQHIAGLFCLAAGNGHLLWLAG